jgi:hypothetical protein
VEDEMGQWFRAKNEKGLKNQVDPLGTFNQSM